MNTETVQWSNKLFRFTYIYVGSHTFKLNLRGLLTKNMQSVPN